MPGSDLVIRILADTSNATGNVNALVTSLGKLAGLGAGAGVAGGIVAQSMQFQDAMARIATAYNSTDFSEGSAKYQQVHDFLVQSSGQLATSFSDLADVYAAGARYLDEYGNRLPTDKVQEFTTAMAELAKVSTDGSSATALGQQVTVFEELSHQATNFTAVASALSELASQHNLGEGTTLDAAIGIAQVGADMGVTQAQSLGLGNFLSSQAIGGQMGGTSFGRILGNVDAAAQDVLDPTAQHSTVERNRSAQERLDDLQTSLKEEEARKAQMYGQHGLKTQYRRDPAAVTSADDRIAKLQRDIQDQQDNIAHLGDGTTRGGLNLNEMAKTAGVDATQFAQEFQTDPVTALLHYASGLQALPENQRLGAEITAGFKNQRDRKVINALANNPNLAAQFISEANGQLNDPTDLASRSAIPLGTTSSHVADAADRAQAVAAAAGNGPRQAIDALTQKLLDNTSALDKLDTTLAGNALLGTITTGVVSGVSAAVPVAIATVLARGAGGKAATAVASGAASTAAGNGAIASAVGGGGVLDVASSALAVIAPFILADAWKAQHSSSVEASAAGQAYAQRHPIGVALPDSTGPTAVNVGGVTVNVPAGKVDFASIKDDVINTFAEQFSAAWNAAFGEHPVTGQQGGDYTTGTGPN